MSRLAVRLRDGDYAIGSRGMIEEVSGKEELLQRALIRLQAKRGCFPLDPELGSELYRLDLNRAEAADIEPLIREALSPLPEIQTLGVSRTVERESGRLLVQVGLRIGDEDSRLVLNGGGTEG